MILIINPEGLDLRKLLQGHIPKAAVLGQAKTPQQACVQAKMLLSSVQLGKQPFERLLLMDPEHPTDQQTTKLYSREWLTTAYAYRLPCGEWETCQNPLGPIAAHYSSPSKNPKRTGPILCRVCRTEHGPSQLNREITAERNRRGAGVKRPRKPKPAPVEVA
jgi:hypothetical protein